MVATELEPASTPTEIASRIRVGAGEQLRSLYALETPLLQALWVLRYAKDYSRNEVLSVEEICDVLKELEVPANPRVIVNALNRAEKKVIYEDFDDEDSVGGYSIAWLGRTALEEALAKGAIDVWFIEPSTRWRAYKHLGELGKMLPGALDIVDPYFGRRTLDSLELFLERKEKVRFLTFRTSEDERGLLEQFKDFGASHPNLEMRRAGADGRELHDRYALSEKAIAILGQGIKDIGAKESFVVKLDKELAPEILGDARRRFDSRWVAATLLVGSPVKKHG